MPYSSLPANPPAYPIAPAKRSWRIAAPSFVRHAGIAENCTFLKDHVDEVGLCLFEAQACLAYDDNDLPPQLADLDLSYHVHLPLDLDWSDAPSAWQTVERLVQKTAYLSPTAYVFHPHDAAPPADIASRFMAMGINPEHVLLENIHQQPLTNLWTEIVGAGLSVCLDLGHVLAYSQQPLLELPGLWDRVRMTHLNAPDPRKPARHAGLPLLDHEGRNLLQVVLAHLDRSATVMIEVFDEPGLMTSLNFFDAFAAQMGTGAP